MNTFTLYCSFILKMCMKSFSRKDSLRRHSKRCTSSSDPPVQTFRPSPVQASSPMELPVTSPSAPPSPQPSTSTGGETYSCPRCLQTFATMEDLRSHVCKYFQVNNQAAYIFKSIVITITCHSFCYGLVLLIVIFFILFYSAPSAEFALLDTTIYRGM